MEKKMIQEMNVQINREMYSAYLYLAMSAYLEAENFGGFAQWMKAQASEEMTHAMKLYSFIFDRGGVVVLEAIDKPESNFKSVQQVFEKTLEHEKFITKSINNLYALAQKQDDHASAIFLQWFITEQVEEEKNAMDILAKLQQVGPSAGALIMLDKQLGKRALPNPAVVSKED